MKTAIGDGRWVMGYSLLPLALFVCCALSAHAALFNNTTNYSVGNSPRGAWLGNLRGVSGQSCDLVVANYDDNTVSIRLCLDDGTFGQEFHYTVGLNPAAVRTGDFNRDGLDDIAVVNSGTNTVSILKNLGVGANFSAATDYVVGTILNPNPSAIAIADVNGDGKLDLIVANHDEDSVSILFGLGGGLFGGATNNYAVGQGPSSVCVARMDTNSPYADIIVANTTDGTVTILYGATNGIFATSDTFEIEPLGDPQPVSVQVGDFNNDGFMDIATANFASNTVSIILQDVGNNFAVAANYPVGSAPKSLLLRDLNRDGIVDFAVANSGDDNVQVYLGAGDATFSDQGTYSTGDDPAVVVGSNFNSDRATDMAVGNSRGSTVTILMFAAPLADNVIMHINEDTPSSIVLLGRILDNSPLSYVLTDCPSHGSLNTICPTNDYLTNLVYTPDTNFYGTDTFHYRSTDNTMTSTLATVTITILAVDDAPSFDLSASGVTMYQDSATTNISGFATNISKGPTNEFSQTLTFICTADYPTNFTVKPSITSGGALSMRPSATTTGGTFVVSVFLRDNGGTLRGGVNTSATQTFNVVILPNLIRPVAGTYSGLFYDTNGVVAQDSSGFMKFTLKANRTYTGKFYSSGGTYPVSGLFDRDGFSHTAVVRDTTTVGIDITLDLAGGSDQATAILSDGIWTAAYVGDRALYNASTNPAPQVGNYTMTIPGYTNNPVTSPAGDGYATLTVSSNGVVTAVGKTADGAAFSQSANLSKSGQWPFYAPLYSARGSVLSWMTFTNRALTSLEGEGSWIKPTIHPSFYPDGFTNLMAISGSTYTSPPPNVTVLALTNGTLYMRDGNLAAPLTNAAILNFADNKVYIGTNVVMKLTSSSGLMSGTFNDTGLQISRALRGVVLQQENTFRGYFRGTNQSGSVLLETP